MSFLHHTSNTDFFTAMFFSFVHYPFTSFFNIRFRTYNPVYSLIYNNLSYRIYRWGTPIVVYLKHVHHTLFFITISFISCLSFTLLLFSSLLLLYRLGKLLSWLCDLPLRTHNNLLSPSCNFLPGAFFSTCQTSMFCLYLPFSRYVPKIPAFEANSTF